MIGSKANSNAVPPQNTAVSFVSAPAASPLPDADDDRYKALAGKWEVIEEPSQIYDDAKSVTWRYEATVSGNVLTLNGEIYAIDNSKYLDAKARLYRAQVIASLKGLRGKGEYTLTHSDGSINRSKARIQLEDDLTGFEGEFESEERVTYKLTGRMDADRP